MLWFLKISVVESIDSPSRNLDTNRLRIFPVLKNEDFREFPAGVPCPGDGMLVGGASAAALRLRSACSISVLTPTACSRVWTSRRNHNTSWVASAACRGGRLRLAVRADRFTVVIDLAGNDNLFFDMCYQNQLPRNRSNV